MDDWKDWPKIIITVVTGVTIPTVVTLLASRIRKPSEVAAEKQEQEAKKRDRLGILEKQNVLLAEAYRNNRRILIEVIALTDKAFEAMDLILEHLTKQEPVPSSNITDLAHARKNYEEKKKSVSPPTPIEP